MTAGTGYCIALTCYLPFRVAKERRDTRRRFLPLVAGSEEGPLSLGLHGRGENRGRDSCSDVSGELRHVSRDPIPMPADMADEVLCIKEKSKGIAHGSEEVFECSEGWAERSYPESSAGRSPLAAASSFWLMPRMRAAPRARCRPPQSESRRLREPGGVLERLDCRAYAVPDAALD